MPPPWPPLPENSMRIIDGAAIASTTPICALQEVLRSQTKVEHGNRGCTGPSAAHILASSCLTCTPAASSCGPCSMWSSTKAEIAPKSFHSVFFAYSCRRAAERSAFAGLGTYGGLGHTRSTQGKWRRARFRLEALSITRKATERLQPSAGVPVSRPCTWLLHTCSARGTCRTSPARPPPRSRPLARPGRSWCRSRRAVSPARSRPAAP